MMNGQKRRGRVFALLLVSALLVAAIASADTVTIASIQDWNGLVAKAAAQVGGADGFTDKNVIINVTGDITNITKTLVFAGNGWDITINGGDSILSGDSSTQLIRIGDMNNANNTVSITDLTMEKGNAAGPNAESCGGALFVGGDATLDDCVFTKNTANSHGGAVYVTGTADITGSTFEESFAGASGGGVYAGGDANITGSIFDSNNHAMVSGGGVYAEGDANITDSTFDGNVSGQGGGGVYAEGDANIMGSTFDGNNAGLNGGGVYAEGDANITGSTFDENKATAGNGGGVYAGVNTDIKGSTFDGNDAGMDGGGVYAGVNTDITGSEFYGNTSQLGGGAITAQTDVNINGTNYFDANTPDGNKDYGIDAGGALHFGPGAVIIDGRKPAPPPAPSGASGGRTSSGGTRPVDYQTARIRAQGGTAPVLEQGNKNANVIGQAKDGEPIRLIQWAAGETYCKILYDGGNRAGWVAGKYIQP